MAPTVTTTKTTSILKLPLDTRNDPSLLHFNQLVYIPETGIWAPGKKSTPIFDFSSHFDRSSVSWFTDDYVGFNEDVMAQAKEIALAAISNDQNAAEDIPNPSVIFKLSRTHWYNDSKLTATKPVYDRRLLDALDSESDVDSIRKQKLQNLEDAQEHQKENRNEIVLAESSSPLLAFGVTNITFPSNSLHSSHPITVRPTNATRRSQSFVHDSVSYAWDVNKTLFPGGGAVLSLYKGVGSTKKIEIGRYQSDNGKVIPGGVMVIDSDEVDVLIAVLTLLAVLAQRDSTLLDFVILCNGCSGTMWISLEIGKWNSEKR
ncbi:hypothetical protein TSTA_039570 [Talaromyces stipitatus ATCC 10500]|uniref:Uncharacterized protein n=1 Tax=Talaromyces stipitatus (strain ATCC 10500 / CBS 375.48 / QM 6759 / NRRL 1006) TaxID=441959 RepID=B8M417_TALSN|nr:uncharacterized protein TSTA_039570 [Talaromyces stipitatus ATCC 10500]EED20760.1 hypothetical protein TSTA_039570 [Talaromyces stipitatus ATCC 10500]